MNWPWNEPRLKFGRALDLVHMNHVILRVFLSHHVIRHKFVVKLLEYRWWVDEKHGLQAVLIQDCFSCPGKSQGIYLALTRSASSFGTYRYRAIYHHVITLLCWIDLRLAITLNGTCYIVKFRRSFARKPSSAGAYALADTKGWWLKSTFGQAGYKLDV